MDLGYVPLAYAPSMDAETASSIIRTLSCFPAVQDIAAAPSPEPLRKAGRPASPEVHVHAAAGEHADYSLLLLGVGARGVQNCQLPSVKRLQSPR